MYGDTYSKSMEQPGKVANPDRGKLNREEKENPSSRSCVGIWSRKTSSVVPSRITLLISILRLNLVRTYGIPPEFRGGVQLFFLNRHTPSAQSRVYRVMQLIAYRWRSLPRVRRHRASKPQGSSKRVLPWQVTMDQ